MTVLLASEPSGTTVLFPDWGGSGAISAILTSGSSSNSFLKSSKASVLSCWVSNRALNCCSFEISTPDSFLNFQPLGASINVGIPNFLPALAPASSNPVCPPVLILSIFVLRLGDSIQLLITHK